MTAQAISNMSLVEPCREYEHSYRRLIQEIVAHEERPVPFTLGFRYERFEDLLKRLKDNSMGFRLPEGFVAHSSFWLVQNESEIVGVSNLRHELTPALHVEGGHIGYCVRPSLRGKGFGSEILRQTLSRARSLGLTKVLLTCGKNNIASAKVIVANGGVLESEAYYPPRDEVLQKYWINLAATAT
jgi:predicted acetyltransferase